MPDNEFPYQKEWQKYRRLKNRIYILGILGVLSLFLATPVFYRLGLSDNGSLAAGIAVFMIVGELWGYSVYRFDKWRCPKCRGDYFYRWSLIEPARPFGQTECFSCGLSRYEGSTFFKAPLRLNLKD